MSDVREEAEDKVNENQSFDDAFAEFSKPKNASEETSVVIDEPDPDPVDGKVDDPAAVSAVVPDPAKGEDAQKQGSQEEDWKAKYEAQVAENETLTHRLRSDSGRISAFQRELDTLKKAADEAAAERAKISDDDPDITSFDEEFPDVSKPVKKLIEKSQQESKSLKEEVDNLKATAEETAEARRIDRLTEAHPDWSSVVRTPEYVNWVNAQPGFIQDAVRRNGEKLVDADEAAAVIALFKDSLPKAKPSEENGAEKDADDNSSGNPDNDRQSGKSEKLDGKRQRQLDSSATVAASGRGAATGAPADFDSAFDYFASKKK